MRKYLLTGLGAFAGVASAFAEGEAALDTTWMSSLQQSIVAWGGTVSPFLIAIATTFLGFWLIKIVLKLLKGVASTSK